MSIDINNNFDRSVLNRLANLEERLNDVLTAQSQFVSVTQTHELLVSVTTELKTLNETLNSIEKRLTILENLPDLNF